MKWPMQYHHFIFDVIWNSVHCALWYFCGSRMILLTHKWFGQETSPRYGARVSLTAWSLSGLTNYKSGRLLLHTQKLLIYTLYLVHQRCHLAWSRFFCFNWFFSLLVVWLQQKYRHPAYCYNTFCVWYEYRLVCSTYFEAFSTYMPTYIFPKKNFNQTYLGQNKFNRCYIIKWLKWSARRVIISDGTR